jgi:hypothetical protein
MSQPILHAYAGINQEGNIGLFVSISKLPPLGNRQERGPQKLPASCYALYSPEESQTMEGLKKALVETNAFLAGEMAGSQTLEFGKPLK